jgi:magnesium chelatase accessory protein
VTSVSLWRELGSVHDAPIRSQNWPNHEHSKFILRGNIRWHVQRMGSGPALLLLHGTGASSHSFRDLMPLLAKHFTVIAPDLPGHAFTEVPHWFDPTLPTMSAALEELIDALGVAPRIAVGHSAGAAILARMTLDGGLDPDLLVGIGAALVPFNGVARAVFPRTARLLAVASKIVDLKVSETESVERLLRKTGSFLDASGVELYRRLSERPGHVSAVLSMMSRWNVEPLFEELPQLRAPFLFLAGERDRAVPIAQQREVASRVPHGKLVVIDDAGHLAHEERPELVARVILAEIDGVAQARVAR